ncbi:MULTISPECIES: amino acid synthesis family protein [Vibrio]|uniref:amino acid synthesis family protein n=1 Tax=Vibrio TaxID=662 RepID=UPI001B303008|nr:MULTISPECIES: amino acid synthesis family protein [Vibrio]MCG9558978.1 amino acid synthesis family protein [Vibrio kanaloae]UOE89820.1 amino acid synthesis family protein [Vibrio splendidus]UPR30245.1 amino acid synthesis family protein [Vibrio crassostreae]
MAFNIRKICTYIEETRIEGGKVGDKPVMMAAVAVVIENPWHGRGFVENLRPEVTEHCSDLGALIVDKLVGVMGGAENIEAYGKAAVVGMEGEIEHASAVIHTLRFGNHYREAVEAKSYLSFTNKRGAGGTSIQVPMMHKDDEGLRSHYVTLEMKIEDAPAANEIVVVLGASDGGRVHPRIGNRYIDLEELAQEKANEKQQ